jgi:hypothetical protein
MVLVSNKITAERGQATAVGIPAEGGGQVAFALLVLVLYCWPAARGQHLTGYQWPHRGTSALLQSATLTVILACNKKTSFYYNKDNFYNKDN